MNFKIYHLILCLLFLFDLSVAQNSASKSSESSSDNPAPSKSNSNNENSGGNASKSASSGKPSSSARIPLNAARGMITFIEPPVAQNFIAGWSIGSIAKMKWKFDNNLKIKPNNISIIAIRQDSGAIVTYNIGLELPGDTTEFEWDTANFTADPNNPPLVESDNYKLYIFDTARSYLAGAPAGALNPFTRQFRLYKGGNGGSNLCLTCLSSALTCSTFANTLFLIVSTTILIYFI